MVVGQDWEPISDINKLSSEYKLALETPREANLNIWDEMVRKPKSTTCKFLLYFLEQSARIERLNLPDNFIDDIYVTNAVLCARRGNNYRGNNNFLPRICTHNCSGFLERQIRIVKPMVIITLGEWSLWSLNQIFNLGYDGGITTYIERLQKQDTPYLRVSDSQFPIYVVPVFHPVAMRSKAQQIEDYRGVWKALLEGMKEDDIIKHCFSKRLSKTGN